MPVLPAEPSIYPDDLLSCESPQVGQEARWWVLHTKPRQEKSLARQLYKQQIPFYLPLILNRRRSRGRMLSSYVPLFSSYVFFSGSREQRIASLATRRVVHCLEVGDQKRIVEDLRQIKQLIDAGAPVTAEEKLQPGMRVEIREGPLAGLKGKVIRSASGKRFVVEVDFIQRGASILFDDFALAKEY